jgi:hypothetical protein
MTGVFGIGALGAVFADNRRDCPDRDRTQTLYDPKRNRRCKNVAACTNNTASGENSTFIDHCGRSILYGFYVGRIQSPVSATVLFIAFVVAHRAVFVEAYEWRQGVLYGPYLKACRLSPQEGTMMPIRLTLGLIQDPSMTTAWHLWTIIVPRRTITGRLVRGQVWRRHDGRRWLYKKFSA